MHHRKHIYSLTYQFRLFFHEFGKTLNVHRATVRQSATPVEKGSYPGGWSLHGVQTKQIRRAWLNNSYDAFI